MRDAGLGALAVAALVIAGGCGDRKKPPEPAGDDAAVARPRPTARPLDDAGLAALAAVTIPGHQLEVVRRGPDFGALVRVADMMATVTISACSTCTPLEAAAWEEQRAPLTALLAPGPTDRLALEVVDRGGWSLVELRAHRTIEDAPQSHAIALWNDGTIQLLASCEHPGADQAERACLALVEAAALHYLPVLAAR